MESLRGTPVCALEDDGLVDQAVGEQRDESDHDGERDHSALLWGAAEAEGADAGHHERREEDDAGVLRLRRKRSARKRRPHPRLRKRGELSDTHADGHKGEQRPCRQDKPLPLDGLWHTASPEVGHEEHVNAKNEEGEGGAPPETGAIFSPAVAQERQPIVNEWFGEVHREI